MMDQPNVNSAGEQSNRAASAASYCQEGSPKYHAYQGEIPTGWRALSPVLYPDCAVPDGSGLPDARAAVDLAFRRFQAGLLLCRQGANGQEALREFLSGPTLQAAFLTQDGQYQQVAPVRPAYGVLPLAAPSSNRTDQFQRAEYLVLLPLIRVPVLPDENYLPMRLFVDGIEISGINIDAIPVWPGRTTPAWWDNAELRMFLTASHRKLTMAETRAEALLRFGEGVPSLSALHRYWQRLDAMQSPNSTPHRNPNDV